jgi:hypothetical protein
MAKGAGWCDDDEDADAGDERLTGDDMPLEVTESCGDYGPGPPDAVERVVGLRNRDGCNDLSSERLVCVYADVVQATYRCRLDRFVDSERRANPLNCLIGMLLHLFEDERGPGSWRQSPIRPMCRLRSTLLEPLSLPVSPCSRSWSPIRSYPSTPSRTVPSMHPSPWDDPVRSPRLASPRSGVCSASCCWDGLVRMITKLCLVCQQAVAR